MKFSVLMSVYKNDKVIFLEEALESLMNQTKIPNEIVLVKDGPISDELNKFIKEYSRKNSIIKVVESKENIGLGNALKLGMKFCSYDIVARMDSDDICKKNRFEKQLDCFIKDKNLSIVGSNIVEFIGTTDNIVGSRVVPDNDIDIKHYAKKRCPLNHVSVMFKKKDVESVGGYIHWHYNEDYYLWLRMIIDNCKFKNINENLVMVRVGEEMYKRRGGIKYFKSEADIQKFMLEKNIIGHTLYLYNILVRFIVQIVVPNEVRGMIFKKLCRASN